MKMPDLDHVDIALPGKEIVERIKAALEIDGTHSWDNVQVMLITGAAQIFWNDHGAWITEIVSTPRKQWLHIWIIAGQLPGVMDIQEQAERFARTKSLERMIATTREGWAVLADKPGWEKFGWKKFGAMLVHPIDGV